MSLIINGTPSKLKKVDPAKKDKELHMTLQETTCMVQDRRVRREKIDEQLTHVTALPELRSEVKIQIMK